VTGNKISLMVDEELVRRVRQHAIEAIGKSDAEIVEDALSAYLDDRVFAATGTGGSLEPGEADRLALEEVHSVRRSGGNPA
jgi:predicted transcriptional regulator